MTVYTRTGIMGEREIREIQLSRKQLVFLFISAAVVAIVIFLLGVAAGRDVRGGTGEALASSGATEMVVPSDPPVQPAQDLTYHEMLTGTGARTPPPASTPVTPPTPINETEPPVPAPAAATPPAQAGDWFLQVGAFSGRPAADNLVASLKKLDVPAFVLAPSAGAADRLFRVRVGPYATQDEANGVRARLVREGYQPRVTR